ncbi:hypothetical protein [Faecalibacterium prausnitzii]|nr:hypothetical protein [Faecalibacterium prausnitzii]
MASLRRQLRGTWRCCRAMDFCAIYDFSVKKTAAGLIFWPFSCKLKDNHARVFFARQNPAKRATHGIKIAKNNGA